MRRFVFAAFAALLACGSASADPSGAGLNPGNTGTQSYMSGCVYRSTPPTATNGQQMGIGCNASGALVVASGTGSLATQVQGIAASGATAAPNPVVTGLQNGTVIRSAQSDANGYQYVLPLASNGIGGLPSIRSDTGGLLYGITASTGDSLGTVTPSVTQSASTAVVKASAGNYYGAFVTLDTGEGPGFFMVFNSTTVPADGAVTPQTCFYLPAGPSSHAQPLTPIPERYTVGMSWAFSTGADCQTKTAAPANHVKVMFR